MISVNVDHGLNGRASRFSNVLNSNRDTASNRGAFSFILFGKIVVQRSSDERAW